LTGAGVAAIRWAVNSRRKDPPDPLEEIQRELADKGSVDLLLPDGRWRWHEWVAGEAEWTAGPEGGGFDAPRGRTRLLEVARGLSDSGFRLTVRFRQARPGAEVGVYVGRSQQPSSRGPSHCLVALVADDYRPPPGPGGQPYVARWVLARSAPADGNGEFWDAPPIDRPPPASGRPGDWIDAVLTLTADRLSVQADGREFRRRSRSQLLPSAQQLGFARTGFEGLTPTFHPTEGVGLFATNSRIEVSTARLDRPDRD
jgi:hypothetical protein